MQYQVDWVDAFAECAFAGNGCAVVHAGAGLPDETCMAFVRETSLVECTFTGPSDVADIRVRYFLASREIPFAGHPTLASVAAMRDRGLIEDGALTLETRAGVIPVSVQGKTVTMRQNAPDFGASVEPALVAAAMGLPEEAIVGQPRMVSTGLPFCVTEVRDRATLMAATLSPKGLSDYALSLGHGATDIMEPYLVTLDAPDGADTFGRLLMASPSPPEDPFTGSATGCAAAYLWSSGRLSKTTYTAAQGDGMGRPGRAEVSLIGTPDAIDGVNVKGTAHILMSGALNL
jgi:PhzF family phenazine biosynthesis protein